MTTLLPKISFDGEKCDQVNLLQKVFERAQVLNEKISDKNEDIEKEQSILIISKIGDIGKYESYLKKMNSELDEGTLSHGFIWYPDAILERKGELESLISTHLSRKITYNRHSSVIRFVEDFLKTVETDLELNVNKEEKHLSVFFNILDKEVGDETSEMLTDIFEINKISVDSSDENLDIDVFSNFALEARLIVIIFNNQKEWAEIFSQEIWKKIGGVSSGIPILLIGTDSDERINVSIPNVSVANAAKELLALEIKVQYDSLIKND